MTPFSDIYGLFLVQIQDYKIDMLSSTPTNMENYLHGFLELAIPEFYNCQKDLNGRDNILKQFNVDLTLEEQKILANWMVYHWFLREVQDIKQFSLLLTDTDFKTYSSANYLKEKSSYANMLREICTQRTVDYGIKNIPWSDWKNGNYS